MARLLLAVVVLFAIGNSTPAAAEESEAAIVQKIVGDFYSWYIDLVTKDIGANGERMVIREKGDLLSTELLRLLSSDDAASSKPASWPGIVWIDFDPFLNTQDPVFCCEFSVGRTDDSFDEGGNFYFVEIRGRFKSDSNPYKQFAAAFVDVRRRDGKLKITNVRYPGGYDLLSLLSRFEKKRLAIKNGGVQ